MRNFNKAVAEGDAIRSGRPRLDMRTEDVMELLERARGGSSEEMIDVIVSAYSAGLAVGMRNGRA